MERFAPVALRSRRVVLALAHQVILPVLYALRRVPVTLAPTADLQVRHRVKIRVPGELRVVLVFVPERVQPVERHLDVGGRDPVLQDGRVVKVVRRGSAIQGAERNEPTCQRLHVCVRIRADRFLLVLLRYCRLARLVVHFLALGRVELERHPRFPIIHRLVDSHGFGSRRAELQAHVSHLKLLAEGQRQRHILRILHVVLRLPAREVMRVVEVRQISGWVRLLGVRGVANVAVSGSFLALLGHHAVPGRRRAAGAGDAHVLAERGVHEVGDATSGVAVLVVTRVRRGGLSREHTHPVHTASTSRHPGDGHHGHPRYQNPYHCVPRCSWRCNEEDQE